MTSTTRQTFEQWMKKVDAVLVRRVGVDSMDLPDVCYSEMFEDGFTAAGAAARALRAANGDEPE